MKKTSFIITIKLETGLYRHLKISSEDTLFDLHQSILFAYEFDDDHAHAFFLDNKAWSDRESYFVEFMENEERYTNEYKLGDVLKAGQNFLYIFDFGEEWQFSCKVLKELDEAVSEVELIKSVGEAPSQY